MSDREARVGAADGTCCWCPNAADSDEDIIPKWVKGELTLPAWPVSGPPRFSRARDGVVRSQRVQTLTPKLARTRAVCRRCNSEWMSQQETKAKAILGPLIRGHQRTMSAVDQIEVALWACIKAGVCDSRPGSDDGGLMSEASRQAIVQGRPPSDMLVRLAAYEAAYDLGVYTMFGDGTRAGGEPLAQWATTIVIGHLVVQVVGRTGSSRQPVLQGLPGGVHDGRSFTVWPPRTDPVQWPPPVILTVDTLGPFLTEMIPGADHAPDVLLLHRDTCRCGETHPPYTRELPVEDA